MVDKNIQVLYRDVFTEDGIIKGTRRDCANLLRYLDRAYPTDGVVEGKDIAGLKATLHAELDDY